MNAKRFQLTIVFLAAFPIISIAVLAATGTFAPKELKVYGEVPAFSLVERHGQKISKDTLKNKVWVASFIFTHCSGQCPLIMNEVKKVQSALLLKENFRLLSVTVDPENDTPEELAKYADKLSADPFKWWFATGEMKEIKTLVQSGFKLSAGTEEDVIDVTHSSKLVLVDGYGKIRGYYDANEGGEVKQLIKDAKKLLKQTYLN